MRIPDEVEDSLAKWRCGWMTREQFKHELTARGWSEEDAEQVACSIDANDWVEWVEDFSEESEDV